MIRRRGVLSSMGAVCTVSIAGCLGEEGTDNGETDTGESDTGENDSPTDVVEARFEALNNGDNEKTRELSHSEREDTLTQEDLAVWEEADIELNNVELIEQSDEVAIVEIVLVADFGFGPEAQTQEIELRKENGEWRIYESQTPGGETHPDSGVLFDEELTQRGEFTFEAVSGQELTVELGNVEDQTTVRIVVSTNPDLDLVYDQTHHSDTTIQETVESDGEYFVEYMPSVADPEEPVSITFTLSEPP